MSRNEEGPGQSVGDVPTRRYAELVMERTVERFLARLFLRDVPVRVLCIVAPFISAMEGARFSLVDLRRKVEAEEIPTYVITRKPEEEYQVTAMKALYGCPWVEIRYNASLHAKLYLVRAERESDSFALFGSGNLTARSVERNIELGMMVYGQGPGRGILDDLYYLASNRLRIMNDSRLEQAIHCRRRVG